ncbi:MAG: aminotransferase class I/II-fold pyridoxal phosphate-dependent enzyme [Planctomycetota bacterium]
MGHRDEPGRAYAAYQCTRIGTARGDGHPLAAPIVQSTTFARSGVGTDPTHQYSRVSNPSVSALEKGLGELEGAPPAVCFGTGLAAEAALFLAVLRAGDHVACARCVYGGTTRLLQDLLPRLGITCTFIDARDPSELAAALRPRTRLVFLETPSNPTLEITDISACATIAKRHGAIVAVDNTFLTPILQNPLNLGADISVYSTTKFIDGHSVALGGALVSRDERLLDRVRHIRKCTGSIQSPFNAWLTCQGVKTLALRIREQSRSAHEIADWLKHHPSVVTTHYPSLKSDDARRIAREQHAAGNGAVVSFELETFDDAHSFVSALRLCTPVEHVGSVETLITHPATMTHADVPIAERRAVGISDGLLRLSVGLEPVGMIIEDLERAFTTIRPAPSPTPSRDQSEVSHVE